MEQFTIDRIDLELLHALSIDGRASFSRLAAVLRVSDQTVARRYRRLHDAGVARVLGILDPVPLGEVDWALRLTCVPEAAGPFARALASRSDTSWVRLASGGTQILFGVHANRGDETLLARLASARRVLGISAHCIIHRFRGWPTHWPGITQALSGEQVASLTPAPPVPADAASITLTDGDRALIDELSRDGRVPNTTLAATTGWHESTVRRRIEQLRSAGVLYLALDLEERLLGYHANTVLWASVAPAHLIAVGNALAQHDEIVFAAATTGPTNLMASVLCRDMDDLHVYLSTKLGALPAIDRIETMPIVHTIKRAAIPHAPT